MGAIMKNMTLEHIAQACGGTYIGEECDRKKEIQGAVIDSRLVGEGYLFIPIRGARVDGHDFIPAVFEKGALAVLSEQRLEHPAGPYILVDSTEEAMKKIAAFYRRSLDIKVVGITGSVGKTSTKEVIASVLKEKYRTLKTQGNFNNELGLPLTVFRLRDEDEIAVLEMGISDFGEMTRLAKIAKPDTCVITNIGTCHLENLGDRDGVLKAKTEIFQYVKRNIVLNGDDDKLSTVKEYNGMQPVFFGNGENASVTCENVESRGLKGMSCDICLKGKMAENGELQTFHVDIPMPGRHMVSNALAAAAVGRLYGLNAEQIKNGIESLEPVSGRFNMIETDKFMIVDDCYNANPMSMKASLDVLQDGLGRKVAILGDMGELGTDEAALHEGVGVHAGQCRIDACICVGPLAAHIAEKASQTNPDLTVIREKDLESLLKNLNTYVKPGDTILVKASHFMKFENVVKALQEM